MREVILDEPLALLAEAFGSPVDDGAGATAVERDRQTLATATAIASVSDTDPLAPAVRKH